MNSCNVCVYLGAALARYAFGERHPFGPHRLPAFETALRARGLQTAVRICAPVQAEDSQLELFHTRGYLDQVSRQSETGEGYLDTGDTPAFPGVYEAAATVVGSVLDAVDRLIKGECRRAFVPIAGLHHAHRDYAAGFCVFNDCGIAIETLRTAYGIQRIAYVDIDAHHGDGVYDGFAGEPAVTIVDFHEDGRFLYPGSGSASEIGTGAARGTKMNFPMPPGATDELFLRLWQEAERFLRESRPEFIIFQCGADSLSGDPITHLRYTEKVHAHVATRLCAIADESAGGRLLGLGGGGYDLDNISRAWSAVVQAFIEAGARKGSDNGIIGAAGDGTGCPPGP